MSSSQADTVACVITPLGEGGIGVVVVTGPGAPQVLGSAFVGTRRKVAQIAPGTIAHGRIVSDGATVDEVIVAYFDGTSSPTGEPWFEVNCHGGVVAVRAVLDCLRLAGARVVSWHDLPVGGQTAAGVLSPASLRGAALSRLPRAQTRLAAKMLLHQARGVLADALGAVRHELVACRTLPSPTSIPTAAGRALEMLRGLVATAPLGTALVDPPKVLIAGPQNVGKSTLLNALLHRERVIVHPHPGTTRDVVRETVSIRGVPFELMDSAGIRHGGDELEQQAIKRTTDLLAQCDVLLLVYDVRQPVAEALRQMPPLDSRTRTLVIGNKIDLCPRLPEARSHIFISAREGRNLSHVEDALVAPYKALIPACERGGPVVFTEDVRAALERVASRLQHDGPEGALRELEALGA